MHIQQVIQNFKFCTLCHQIRYASLNSHHLHVCVLKFEGSISMNNCKPELFFIVESIGANDTIFHTHTKTVIQV